MRLRLRVTGLILGATALVAVGSACGRGAGSPQPGTGHHSASGSAASSASSASSAPAAPTVAHPLQAGRYLQHPCGVLSTKQLKSFGFTSSTKPEVRPSPGGGKECSWHDDSHVVPSGLGLSWITANKHGLSDVYAQKDYFLRKGYFKPTSVRGYPAVFGGPSDGRPSGECELGVGINDHLVFLTIMQTRPKITSKSCSMAKSAAAAAIETLRKGS